MTMTRRFSSLAVVEVVAVITLIELLAAFPLVVGDVVISNKLFHLPSFGVNDLALKKHRTMDMMTTPKAPTFAPTAAPTTSASVTTTATTTTMPLMVQQRLIMQQQLQRIHQNQLYDTVVFLKTNIY